MSPQQPTPPASDPISTAIANVTAAEATYTADAPTLATIQTAVSAGAESLPLQQVASVLANIQANITALQQLIQAASAKIGALVLVQEALTAVQAFPTLSSAITPNAVSSGAHLAGMQHYETDSECPDYHYGKRKQ